MSTRLVRADEPANQPAQHLSFFESKIRPLLVQHCYDCHSEQVAEGKLRLDSKSGWERGGERGPAVVPGDPSSSLLIRAVSHHDEKLLMPPKESGDRLSDTEIEDLKTWIRQGAFDPRHGERIVTDIERNAREHWAFQPIVPPQVDANHHPIDFLIDLKLRERNFVVTDSADPRTLIRRMSLDLLGLPPTADEVSQFAAEANAELSRSAEAKQPQETIQHLINRLLESPRYGERWGRHWLDVARYADAKDGVLMYGDARIRPFAYTYRDYVIRAFNEDKPFDQFIREQLAADQLNLAADSPELAGLGLLTLGRMFDGNRHDVIDDQIDVIGRGLLGLSLACARCHDHKFDPIPTADYYSLYGVFASCIEPYDRPRIGSVREAGQTFEQEFASKLKEIEDKQSVHYAEILQIARERTSDYLVHIATTEPDVAETAIFFLSLTPEQLRPQITKRWRQLIARRAFPDDPIFGPWYDLQRQLTVNPERWSASGVDPRIIDALVAAKPKSITDVARVYGTVIRDAWAAGGDTTDPLAALLVSRDGPVWFPKAEVANYLSRQAGDSYRGLLGQLDAIAVKHKEAASRAMIVRDAEVLCEPVIFQRGDPGARGTPVPRRFLQVLSSEDRPVFANGSGRLELADAIVSPTNPLTARVWVNRVWMHHMGQSLVENPDDFGLQAARPLQLDLLDFLADFLIQHGWRTKPLHTLIMSSRAYQRSSQMADNTAMALQLQRDPSNSLVWRANRRRLDFEQMRDSMLKVAGELDETMFGRPAIVTDMTNRRRTVYAFVERQNVPAMVQTFDFANADISTSRRSMTTVPQQALFALNSDFVLAQAESLAKRVMGTEMAQSVRQLYSAVYGREPTAEELELCRNYLSVAKLEELAQVLLISNEFMFVD